MSERQISTQQTDGTMSRFKIHSRFNPTRKITRCHTGQLGAGITQGT